MMLDAESVITFLTNNPQILELSIVDPIPKPVEEPEDENPQNREDNTAPEDEPKKEVEPPKPNLDEWAKNKSFWLLAHPNLTKLTLPGTFSIFRNRFPYLEMLTC